MNFGEQENKRVKQAIVDGLFKLLNKKSFSSIKISELIRESKVSRSSYYRNFTNKEEILDYYFQSTLVKETKSLDTKNFFLSELLIDNFIEGFKMFLTEKEHIIQLLNSDLSSYFYNLVYNRVYELEGDLFGNSIERYKLNIYIGSVFSVLSEWLLSGARETPEQMAEITINYLKNGIVD